MDWESLRPVIVGGLIATIPILISNLVQIYLKRMEIKQKEKEEKVQLAEELTRRNIKIIRENIDNSLFQMRIIEAERDKVQLGEITEKERLIGN